MVYCDTRLPERTFLAACVECAHVTGSTRLEPTAVGQVHTESAGFFVGGQ